MNMSGANLKSRNCFVAANAFENLTIYRPTAIAGDSATGYTHTFHGVFHYLKLISVIVSNVDPDEDGRRYTPIKLDMHGDEERNVVPVEWVSEVICFLMSQHGARGKTFHLAPDVCLTPRQIIDAGYSYFNSYGIKFCGSDAIIKNPKSTRSRLAFANMSIYKSYEHSDPEFDCSNLKEFAGHLPCPVIDESVLHRYWEFGERVNWGKRTTKRPATAMFRVRQRPLVVIGRQCKAIVIVGRRQALRNASMS